MSKPEKAVSIDGFKFRSWETEPGYWSDPYVPYDFWSRTFCQEGTPVMEATSEEDMDVEVKKGNKKFKSSELSEDSQQKFKDKGIDDKIEDDQGEDEQ